MDLNFLSNALTIKSRSLYYLHIPLFGKLTQAAKHTVLLKLFAELNITTSEQPRRIRANYLILDHSYNLNHRRVRA